MEKRKRKRIIKDTKVHLPNLNDGMNTPVPDRNHPSTASENEAPLFKQAENPLGDPQKI